jgi:uncharacterized cupin superfamily protein
MELIPTKKKSSPEEVKEAKKWATWEKEESTFDWHYDAQETFYVIEGDVTVTWRDGEISFRTGDLVTFPAGLDRLGLNSGNNPKV